MKFLAFLLGVAGAWWYLDAFHLPASVDAAPTPPRDSSYLTRSRPALPEAPILIPEPPTLSTVDPDADAADRASGRFRLLHDLMAACDYRNSVFSRQAARIVVPENSGPFNLGSACDLLDYFNLHWTYVNDPVFEEIFQPASAGIKTRFGDCDDFAIVLCGALLALGGTAAIQTTECQGQGHAMAWVCLGRNVDLDAVGAYLHARYGDYAGELWQDSDGLHWLNLDMNFPPGASPCGEPSGYWLFPQSGTYCRRP